MILAFIYVPIGIIVLYSFNAAKVATWPITSFTLDWYVKAFSDAGIRTAVGNSIEAAIGATLLALALRVAAGAGRRAPQLLRARDDRVRS